MHLKKKYEMDKRGSILADVGITDSDERQRRLSSIPYLSSGSANEVSYDNYAKKQPNSVRSENKVFWQK